MIEKSIGILRDLIKKRKELVHLVKQVAVADDVITIIHKENKFNVVGHTADVAMTVFMLGTAVAMSYDAAQQQEPELTVHDYMQQPIIIAMKHLERSHL